MKASRARSALLIESLGPQQLVAVQPPFETTGQRRAASNPGQDVFPGVRPARRCPQVNDDAPIPKPLRELNMSTRFRKNTLF